MLLPVHHQMTALRVSPEGQLWVVSSPRSQADTGQVRPVEARKSGHLRQG